MKIYWTAKPPTLRLHLPGFWAKLRILYTSSNTTTILPPSMRTRKHSVAIKLGLPDFSSWMFFSSFLGAQPQGSVSRDRVKKILQVASPLSSHAAVSAMSLIVLVSDNWSVQCATRHVRIAYSKLQKSWSSKNGHWNGFFCSKVLDHTPHLAKWGVASDYFEPRSKPGSWKPGNKACE